MLDVFFITNGEINADENWQRLKQLCPRAQRLDGVQGLYQAHHACALASITDNFWVVDADAWISESHDFAWQPDPNRLHWQIPETECVLIWPAKNPVNGLIYGYGGVKMFPRQPFLEDRSWRLDLSTTISPVAVEMPTVSCETRFNATPESAWIGAFRECVKLSSLRTLMHRIQRHRCDLQKELDQLEEKIQSQSWTDREKANHRRSQRVLLEQKYRRSLDINNYWEEIDRASVRYSAWTQYGYFEHNGPSAIAGACAGVRYGLANADDVQALEKINDWSWLKRQYEIGQ